MKKGITIAGNLIIDIVKKLDAFPKEGMLANIIDVSKCTGGCVGNTLHDLAIIDPSIPLTAIARVGDDDNGDTIKNDLTKVGISIDSVSSSTSEATSFTDVMINMTSGERTFFHQRGANAKFSIEHIDIDTINSDIFHFGYALLLDSFDKEDKDYGTVMARVLESVQRKGIKTSIDVVSESGDRYESVVRPSLKYCNYIILNEIESSRIVDIEIRDENDALIFDNLPRICQKLLELGVSDMVVIHMPECGCAMTKNGAYFIQPSYHLPDGFIKNGVGAGDAFCAGMLYGIYNEWPVETSIEFANMSAACCLSSENSIDGMKSKSEIQKMQTEFSLRVNDVKKVCN